MAHGGLNTITMFPAEPEPGGAHGDLQSAGQASCLASEIKARKRSVSLYKGLRPWDGRGLWGSGHMQQDGRCPGGSYLGAKSCWSPETVPGEREDATNISGGCWGDGGHDRRQGVTRRPHRPGDAAGRGWLCPWERGLWGRAARAPQRLPAGQALGSAAAPMSEEPAVLAAASRRAEDGDCGPRA